MESERRRPETPSETLSSSDGTSSLYQDLEGEGGLKRSKDVPSVSLALPPVGWQRTLVHALQRTTVCACENTVVIAKQPVGCGTKGPVQAPLR